MRRFLEDDPSRRKILRAVEKSVPNNAIHLNRAAYNPYQKGLVYKVWHNGISTMKSLK